MEKKFFFVCYSLTALCSQDMSDIWEHNGTIPSEVRNKQNISNRTAVTITLHNMGACVCSFGYFITLWQSLKSPVKPKNLHNIFIWRIANESRTHRKIGKFSLCNKFVWPYRQTIKCIASLKITFWGVSLHILLICFSVVTSAAALGAGRKN